MSGKKVKPLRAKLMTLEDLQARTLRLCREVRTQLNRPAWGMGLSDAEFLDAVVTRLECDIRTDMTVRKMKGGEK